MSTRASSAKTFATSSLQDSSQDEDSRWRSRGGSGSFHVESSHHSYPKTPGMMPVAYGQHQDLRPFNRSNFSEVGFVPPQPQTHAPGGPNPPSPFVGFTPAAQGFPIQQYQQPPAMVNPLPYNASCPYPTTAAQAPPMPQPAYTTSGSAYLPYNYNQRAQTTGSMYPPGQQGVMIPPTTSYTVPFGATLQHSKSNEEYTDDCFNIFWLFFLLGPLTWPCAMFGVCSEKKSERMAGFVSAVCLVLVVIAAIIIITQAPGDSDS